MSPAFAADEAAFDDRYRRLLRSFEHLRAGPLAYRHLDGAIHATGAVLHQLAQHLRLLQPARLLVRPSVRVEAGPDGLSRRWGTKEQTTHEVDLGVAASAGKDVVDILLVSVALPPASGR